MTRVNYKEEDGMLFTALVENPCKEKCPKFIRHKPTHVCNTGKRMYIMDFCFVCDKNIYEM